MERVVMGEGRGWESRDKRKISIEDSIFWTSFFPLRLWAIKPKNNLFFIFF